MAGSAGKRSSLSSLILPPQFPQTDKASAGVL